MAKKKKKQKYVNKFGVGLLLGAGTGYIISKLTAPVSGEELQSDLTEKAEKLKQKAEETAERLKDKTDQLKEKNGVTNHSVPFNERSENLPVEISEPDLLVPTVTEEITTPAPLSNESSHTLMDDRIEDGMPIE